MVCKIMLAKNAVALKILGASNTKNVEI